MEKIKKSYSLVFLTGMATFYKINLYNRIAQHTDILVIFTESGVASHRKKDFYEGEKHFDHVFLPAGKAKSVVSLITLLIRTRHRELVLGGWDEIYGWVANLLSARSKTSVVIESSSYESVFNGLRGFIKRLFFKGISKVYASGKAQEEVARLAGFRRETVITKGVGIFNIVAQPEAEHRQEIRKFLYVGQLVEKKNLRLLVETFSAMPQKELYLAGFGPQEQELRTIAGDNIHFLGAIPNKELPDVYRSMDAFVLPSAIEPWGLVVEEALNNGLPVIVSDRVGCAPEIITSDNGLIFQHDSAKSLKEAIEKMSDRGFHNRLRENISRMDFQAVAERQAACYLQKHVIGDKGIS